MNKYKDMNTDLNYRRLVVDEAARERERAQRNIDWFNRTVEGWETVVTVGGKGEIITKYIKSKRYGKGK